MQPIRPKRGLGCISDSSSCYTTSPKKTLFRICSSLARCHSVWHSLAFSHWRSCEAARKTTYDRTSSVMCTGRTCQAPDTSSGRRLLQFARQADQGVKKAWSRFGSEPAANLDADHNQAASSGAGEFRVGLMLLTAQPGSTSARGWASPSRVRSDFMVASTAIWDGSPKEVPRSTRPHKDGSRAGSPNQTCASSENSDRPCGARPSVPNDGFAYVECDERSDAQNDGPNAIPAGTPRGQRGARVAGQEAVAASPNRTKQGSGAPPCAPCSTLSASDVSSNVALANQSLANGSRAAAASTGGHIQ